MEDHGFSKDELQRYARHLSLPGFGLEAQRRLKNAKVLVVGAGGLGCPILLYLTAAGVGTIGIIDPDRVSLSNLQRQVLFTEEDIGKEKVAVAKARLEALNPHVNILPYPFAIQPVNALDILREFDLVIDGSDNFSTRYLVNDACVLSNKPNVFGSIFRFEGQVSVFNVLREDGSRGPNYRDLFPSPPPPGQIPNCAEAGVLGVLPGIVGAMQANEAIKLITGLGDLLDGRLFVYDAGAVQQQILKIKAQPKNRVPALRLEDYNLWCQTEEEEEVPEMTAKELQSLLDQGKEVQLVDVREERERLSGHIGGLHIPLANILLEKEKIATNLPVVIYCHSGLRSATAIQQLQKESAFSNLFNLKGGILAWYREKSTP